MGFLFAWAFWGMLAVPAILALYFFKRKRRDIVVNALFLWRNPAAQSGGGRRISKIERSLILFLELLAAACFVMAAVGPGCRGDRGATLVVMALDGSASMSATPESSNGGSFKDRALKKLESLLSSKAPFQCSLIVTGRQPRLLASSLERMEDVREALKRWEPSGAPHSFDPSFALALRIAGKDGYMAFITDAKPPIDSLGRVNMPDGVEWISTGEPADNYAIVSATRKRLYSAAQEEVYATIANFGASSKNLELRLYEGLDSKEPLTVKGLSLEGGSQSLQSIRAEGISDKPFRLELKPGGALKIDDSAVLPAEPKPPLKVRLDFASGELSALFRKTVSAFPDEADIVSKGAQLVFTDKAEGGAAAEDDLDFWRMLVLGGDPKESKALFGPYIEEKSHPLLEGVTLEGVRWAVPSGCAKPDKDVFALVSCSDIPLLAESPAPQGSAKAFAMPYVPERSNLHNTPSWPVMMHNLVRVRISALPGFESRSCRAGEPARASFPKAKMLELSEVASTGTPITLPFSGFPSSVEYVPDAPGVFSAKVDGKDEGLIAFNFLCPGESDLRNCAKSDRKSPVPISGSRRGRINLASWRDNSWIFVLAALSILMLRAFLLKRMEAMR